MINIRPPK